MTSPKSLLHHHWHSLPDLPGRSILEINSTRIPVGLELEMELLDGGGHSRSYGVWRLSQSGVVLGIVGAGEG